jgi:NADP-dependent aldehyde dehydrogenase
MVRSIDARTGEVIGEVASLSTHDDVDQVCLRAAEASDRWAELSRSARSAVLRAMASSLSADADAIVADADRETGLGVPRLQGELGRTTYQLRFFADVVDDGGFLEAAIDHEAETPMGRHPDVRRMLAPLGPVAVFGASNFPLAFSVPGGDTAAALAAGCAVVVKAHPSHPATSIRCFNALVEAVASTGAPRGLVSLVHGQDAGVALVQHPSIRAVGFTGSTRVGRILHDLASARPDPVPFYGELGSVNPVVVTPSACIERGVDIARGLVQSITLGAGQFCTKPGLIFLPSGEFGDVVRDAMSTAMCDVEPSVLLNSNIHDAFLAGSAELSRHPAVRSLTSSPGTHDPRLVNAALLEVAAADFDDELVQEHFGPVAIMVRYHGPEQLSAALSRVPNSLTATIQASTNDELAPTVEKWFRHKAGRIVWNGYPTGVAVSWAMQHGGPWPATTSVHTSVGATAIRRFLRPIAWQNAPLAVLPIELRDDVPGFPAVATRVDGALRLPAGDAESHHPVR